MTLRRLLLGLVALAGACTTLGPLPSTTGVPALPDDRGELAAQVGLVPGTMLSEGSQDDIDAGGIGQLALTWGAGKRFAIPGLVVGARLGGPEHDVYLEPMIGWRRAGATRRLALGVFAFGTRSSGEQDQASYRAVRVGVEGALDVRVTPEHRWFELHLTSSLALQAIDASGRYCADPMSGFGVQCPDDVVATTIDAEASGVYPSGTVGVALVTGRHRRSLWHGARLGGLLGAGMLPRFVNGEQRSPGFYLSAGVLVSFAFGSR